MSLRWSVFWGIVAAIATVVALEALTDTVTKRIVASQVDVFERHADAALERFESRVGTDQPPTDALRSFAADGRAVIVAQVRSQTLDAWAAQLPPGRYHLTDRVTRTGRPVHVAVSATWFEELRSRPLWLDLLDLPVFLALALVAAWLVTAHVERRLERLHAVVSAVSERRSAEPLPTPTGNDEFARLAEAFESMRATVRRYLERERMFTRYASHELRTPLAALSVQLDRLQNHTADADAVVPALRRNVARMEQVMKALQSLSQAGERDTDPVPLEVAVDEALALLPSLPPERVSLTTALPPVWISDASLLRQALANLVDNALTHGTGAVGISVHAQAPALSVRVRNVGPRVDEDELKRLTEPFYRPKGQQSRGLGLGLSLVDVIAQALDGELELRNTAIGFEATLRLPIVLDDDRT